MNGPGHRGSCLCGAVRFEVEGPLNAPDACHCSQCRKHSGHFWASTDVDRRALAIHGEDRLTWSRSSEKVRRGFCARCGSSLFWEPIGGEVIGVAMGAFDTPTNTRLARHIFTGDKGDYYVIADGVPQFLDLIVFVATGAEEAFDAFSDPAHVSRWFTTRHEAQVVPGGRYRNADGDQGRFLEVSRPSLLSFTWENAAHCPGTRVNVRFAAAAPGKTRVHLSHAGLRTGKDVEDMKGGWSWALDSFKSYVETGEPITHEAWLQAHRQSDPA
jgi:uncharacterized protein YndB with AHSA1/START domain